MNQIYKKNEYIVIPVSNSYIVINTNKVFKDGHTHVKNIGIARLLIDLAISKELPKNPYFTDNLIRLSIDKSYIKELKEFKEDMSIEEFEKLMKCSHVYKRHHGAIRQVKHE